MVLSSPASPATTAPAAWLKSALAPLSFREDGSVTVLRARSAAPLRDLLAALDQRFSTVRVCTDAREALALPERAAVVLLALSRESWEALNLARPLFQERKWTAFLWCDPAALDLAESLGADLYDWRSNSIDVPPEPPWWTIDNLRDCEARQLHCQWRGEGLEESVDRAWTGRRVRRLDARAGYAELLAQIDAAKDDFIAFEHVCTMRELWRMRWALAEKKRLTGAAALDLDEDAFIWEWPLVHATPETDRAAIERLRAAGDPEPGLTAALCGFEPEAVVWATKEQSFGAALIERRRLARTAQLEGTSRVAAAMQSTSEMHSIEALLASKGASVASPAWITTAALFGIDDFIEHVIDACAERTRFDRRFLLARELQQRGRFEQALQLISKPPLSEEPAERRVADELRFEGELALGRYDILLRSNHVSMSVLARAIARTFDARGRAMLTGIAHGDPIDSGLVELAIAHADPRCASWVTTGGIDGWLWFEAVASHVLDARPADVAKSAKIEWLGSDNYARALTHLAASRALHRFHSTMPALDHAVQARERFVVLFGATHHFVGRAWLAEGRARFARGEWAAARDTFVRAIASLDASVGVDHPDAHEARFEHRWTRRFLRDEDSTVALRECYAAIVTRIPGSHPRLRSLAERIELPPDLSWVENSNHEVSDD